MIHRTPGRSLGGTESRLGKLLLRSQGTSNKV